MAQTDVTLDPVALKQLQDRLAGFTETRALMTRIGRVMKTDTQMNFRRGQSPQGETWAPLKSRSGQPLRKTGRLMRSIDYQASDDEVVIGTNVKYGPTHQFGAVIRPKNGKLLRFKIGGRFVFAKKVTIPARPFIGLAARQLKKINESIDKWAESK